MTDITLINGAEVAPGQEILWAGYWQTVTRSVPAHHPRRRTLTFASDDKRVFLVDNEGEYCIKVQS